MPRFSYTALSASGETITSTAEAASLPALVATIHAAGATIRSAREQRECVPRIAGVPYLDIIAVYRQIAASIEAGLPLTVTLDMLSTESRNPRLRSLLYFLKSRVAEGGALSEAMGCVPAAFPEVHVAVVRAGEESGRLAEALGELADQAEAFSNMNRRFASALVYPSVIAVAALALLSFGMFAFVPRFRTLFGDLGIIDFPTLTRFAFFVSGTVLPIFMLLLLGIVITAAIVLAQRRAATGRLWLDKWKLRLPGVGQIVEKAALARFSGTLGLLLDSGVELPRAIRLASDGAGNRVVEHVLRNIASQVELGRSLSESMEKTGAMPPSLAWRVGAGEETGTLPESLIRLSRLYASQVDGLVTSLAGLVEPVLIVVIGAGIASLVLGMFLPLVGVIQALAGYSG